MVEITFDEFISYCGLFCLTGYSGNVCNLNVITGEATDKL